MLGATQAAAPFDDTGALQELPSPPRFGPGSGGFPQEGEIRMAVTVRAAVRGLTAIPERRKIARIAARPAAGARHQVDNGEPPVDRVLIDIIGGERYLALDGFVDGVARYGIISDDGQTAITNPKRTSAIRRRFCKNWWNQHWRQLQEAFAVWLADGATACSIPLDGSQNLVLAGRLLQLTAERHIVGDLQFQDEAEEPDEPEDDEDVGFDADLEGEGDE